MTTTTLGEARGPLAPPAGTHPGFRPDVEGLRAVAIGTVLLYHAGVPFVPGGFVGVDVFFVVSGFLITGLLVREAERTGRVSLARFYARRVRRLLPAAALVLVVTSALVATLASVVDRRTFGGDVVAAAAYLVNWRLADRSVDYLAEGVGVSPVQHFWSLAVEEQFYVLWPLLVVGATLLAARTRVRARTATVVALVAVVVPSFLWSVALTGSDPARAFFVTPTRLWELGLGGLLALGGAWAARVPRPLGRALGWAGLAAVAGSAVVLDDGVAWPGSLALVPVLGTAAVLLAGATGSAPAPLSSRPAVWLGGLSYSLYLWHWPLLVAAGWVWGELGPVAGLAVVALSTVPAVLSYRLVENPVRRSARLAASTRASLGLGACLTAAGVAAGLLAAGAGHPDADRAAGGTASGAASLLAPDGTDLPPSLVTSVTTTSPSPERATEDLPPGAADGCAADQYAVEPAPCSFDAPGDGPRVVLAGDSKAFQWAGPVHAIAEERGWDLELATKSACGFADAIRVGLDDRPYEACGEYNANLLDRLLADPPDAVVVSQRHSTAYDADGELSRRAMVDGLERVWRPLEAAGTDVVVLLDNPAPSPTAEGDVYRCVAEHLDDLAACAFPRAEGVESSGAVALSAAAARVDGVDVVDLADVLCDDSVCPPVIDGVLVYRQGSHVTNTFAMSARGQLERELVPLVEDGR